MGPRASIVDVRAVVFRLHPAESESAFTICNEGSIVHERRMYISFLFFFFFSVFATDDGCLGLSEASDSRRSELWQVAPLPLSYLYDGINDPLSKYDKLEGRDASLRTRVVLIPRRFAKESLNNDGSISEVRVPYFGVSRFGISFLTPGHHPFLAFDVIPPRIYIAPGAFGRRGLRGRPKLHEGEDIVAG